MSHLCELQVGLTAATEVSASVPGRAQREPKFQGGQSSAPTVWGKFGSHSFLRGSSGSCKPAQSWSGCDSGWGVAQFSERKRETGKEAGASGKRIPKFLEAPGRGHHGPSAGNACVAPRLPQKRQGWALQDLQHQGHFPAGSFQESGGRPFGSPPYK